jgi:glycosyltransferase involved in cell wall biosynthesis
MKTFVIVPVFNEENRAVDTIVQVLKYTKNSVIVVDDGSTDKSGKLLKNKFSKNLRVIVLSHILNLGKGAAMNTGVEMAWELRGEAVIFIDADGQHNPKLLPLFERELRSNKIVFGYRVLDSKVPAVRRWGNYLASYLIKFLFGVHKKDLLSGYLGFRKEVYSMICWQSKRYGIETEMAAKIGRHHLPIKEIKIDTIYVDKYKGVNLIDAVKIFMQIPFWYFTK